MPEAADETVAERHGRRSEAGGTRKIVLTASVQVDLETDDG